MFITYAISLLFIVSLTNDKKEFTRNYDKRGNLTSEGWTQNEQKADFWTFYHPNGAIAKKGHYENGKKTGYWYFYTEKSVLIKEGAYIANKASDWWVFYSEQSTIKIQFKEGLKDGYALIYNNSRLQKAERYNSNKKTGEWTSYFKFKRDNPDVKL